MTKKSNQTTTPEGGEEKVILDGESKPLLEQRFLELSDHKKREYLHTVFWTIRGCTWFFDTRFTAGMSDYKTFDTWDGNMADVIIKNSGTYSDAWWWSESDNSIGIIFQWNIYRWWWARYFETNRIERPHLNYKEIIDCKFDQAKDEFIITVKCADESKKQISLKEWSKYEFEEALISKLRVPKELLQKEEEIKKILQEEISKEEKELAEQKMYQRAVDIFILKNDREEVQKYISKSWVRLSEDQRKLYVEYLLNGRKRNHWDGMRREDMKNLLVFLKSFEDRDYIKNVCNQMLEKSARRDSKDEIFESIKETTVLWWFDIQDRYTKKIEYYCTRNWYLEEMGKTILESGQDKKLRYKKYYDLHKPTDQSKLSVIAEATWESVEDIFKESFLEYIGKIEKFSYSNIKSFLKTMKEKWYEESLYGKVFDKIFPNSYDTLRRYADSKEEVVNNIIEIRSHTDKKIQDDLLFELFYYTKKEGRENLWSKISKKLSDDEKKSTLDIMVDKYLNEDKQFCDINFIINRWFNDTSKILKVFDKVVYKECAGFENKSWIDYCNGLIATLENKKLLSKDNLLDQIHQLYKSNIDNFCSQWTIRYLIRFYPIYFKDNDFLEDVCDKLIERVWHNFSSGNTIADGFVKAWFDQSRIQNFIKKYLWNTAVLYALIEWFGLNIDKIRVNALIEDFFQQGKIQEAEKLARVWWLYDLRKKRISAWKIENKTLDRRNASRAIEEWWLDESYYKYLIEIDINRCDISEALQLAEKYNLLISDEQFDRYLWKDERLRKADEERKLREKKERESQATEMMKDVLASKISCDINYTQDQKYILVRDKQDWLKLASKNLEWHRDIVADIHANNKDVVWWWRISIDEEQKTVKIYGRSWDFGKVESEYNEILKIIVKTQYSDYEIIIE